MIAKYMNILILCLFLDDTAFKTGALARSEKVSEFYVTYKYCVDCITLLLVYKPKATELQQIFK